MSSPTWVSSLIRPVDSDDHVALSLKQPLRLTGVAAVAVLWTTVGVGMERAGLDLTDDRAISYLGTDPRTMALFRGGLLVATVLLVGFARAVDQRLARRTGFLVVFLVGMAGQAVVATVSIAGHGASRVVHTTAGIVLGLSLPLLMWRFAAGQAPGRWRRQSYALMWLEVAGCIVGIALSQARRAAVAEVVPACVFHLWIIVVTVRWPAWRQATAGPAPVVPARSS
ncbi:MAG: hypothetical protein CYG61_03370 [Actinobacteria bacterium]|nr:MAG: hypothetical protein CYG61_03370 [Actinomycetota bacterium]